MSKIMLAMSMLNGRLILLAAVLFTLGLVLADSVLERNIRWLVAYPVWIYSKLDALLAHFSGMWMLFFFIVIFNTFNLFVGFLSGFLVVLPLLLAVWTGLNVGIVMRKSVPSGSLLMLFLNPVAVFELPAGWISFSLGIEMGMLYLQRHDFHAVWELFKERLVVFFWIVIPLLVVAGLIEAALIQYMRAHTDGGSNNR